MPKKKKKAEPKPEYDYSKFTADEILEAELKFVLSDPIHFHLTWNEMHELTKESLKKNPSILLFRFRQSGKELTPNEIWELNRKYELNDLLEKFSKTGI